MIKLLLPLFAPCLFATPAFAQMTVTTAPDSAPVTPPPVVLELFTSQGCAFCPPADELMGQMIQQQSIIGLSCHVDYFGVRKNNLGKGFCTQRQNEYNRLIGTGPRYTPQLVVNGHLDMIGYEAGKVSAAILKARAEKVMPISLTPSGTGTFNFAVPAVKAAQNDVRLWLAVYDAPKDIAITEGNNLGKKVTYYNVVSRMDDLGLWDGSSAMRAINANLAPTNKGFAIIAQNIRTGHVLAAGSIEKQSSVAAQ